jgi:hypothetical protein
LICIAIKQKGLQRDLEAFFLPYSEHCSNILVDNSFVASTACAILWVLHMMWGAVVQIKRHTLLRHGFFRPIRSHNMANRIDCIEKAERNDPTTSIQSIGGKNADGTRWRVSQQDAIQRIKSGTNEFFVQQGSRAVKVIVATSRHNNEYIKTAADDYEPNNLLSLQSCSIAS